MKRFLQSTALVAALAAATSVPALADVYIIGSDVNGVTWGLADPGGLMTETADGVWEWDGVTLATGFKFNDGTWYNENFPGTDVLANIGGYPDSGVVLGTPYEFSTGSDSTNINFADGLQMVQNPHVVLDLNARTVTVTGNETEVTLAYHLVGEFNEWDLDNPDYVFTQQEDGTYLLENVELSQSGYVDELPTLKIASDNWVENYGSPTSALYPFLLEENQLYTLQKEGANIPYNCEGIYDVVFTPGDEATVIFNRVGDVVVVDKGTFENPWTVTELLDKDPAAEAEQNVWATGYIVGWVNGNALSTGARFEFADGEEVSRTNLLVAASKDERDYTKCLTVQLPATAVRDELNLSDHPEYLHAAVTLFGNFEKYFGVAGLKSVSKYDITPEEVIDPMEARLEGLEKYQGDIYLIGDINSWELADERYKMTRTGTGQYEWEGYLFSGFKFNDGTWNSALVDGTDVPLNIGATSSDPISFDAWYALEYEFPSSSMNFNVEGLETEKKVHVYLDLLNACVKVELIDNRGDDIDYENMVLAITPVITEETTELSLVPYRMEGGPTEFTVSGLQLGGAHFFTLTDINLDEKFLSYADENGNSVTTITEENLTGTLHYTNQSIIGQDGQPQYYGVITLEGFYDFKVRFEGKEAYVEFVKNENLSTREEGLANYTGDVYLIGEFNDNTLADENYRLERTGTGLYEWEGIIKGQFKFNNGTWDEGLIEGTDVPLTIAANGTTSIELGRWYPVSYAEPMNYWFHFDDLEGEHKVHIYLDLLNERVGIVALDEPQPDPEYVYAWVGMEGGAADFAVLVRNHEEAQIAYAVVDEYWEIDGMYVNGEWLPFAMDPSLGAFSYVIDGDMTFHFHAAYKGELTFVDETTGVAELENAIRIYVADGAVHLENLNVGEEVVVYNLGGQIIGRYVSRNTTLSISLEKGQPYVVRAAKAAAKVML